MTERQRVLVADDDPLIQRLVRTHLDRAGFRVLMAGDGEEALDVAAAEQPDLIVLDLMLPKMDGLEIRNVSSASVPLTMTVSLPPATPTISPEPRKTKPLKPWNVVGTNRKPGDEKRSGAT